jgi:hypothetical protein
MTPVRRTRGLILVAGLVSGFICWLAYRLPPPSTSDFEQIWFGARALMSGADPYTVVPTTGTRFPLFYPLTAVLVGVPFAALPFAAARVLWAAASGAVFAWAALRYGRGLPVALLSASFLNAIVQGQWSPLLTAAVVVPSLSWALGVKPSIGAALFAAFPSRRAVIGGLALLGLTLIVSPAWPSRWLEALPASTHMVPLLVRPGGFLLLLALIRWRQPEARLLAVLACVPQTIGLYETLPLFLIPRTRWQGYALAGSSYVAAFSQVAAVPRLPGMTLDAVLADRWPFLFVCLYLPALVMVLLPRPVEGPARSAVVAESAEGR